MTSTTDQHQKLPCVNVTANNEWSIRWPFYLAPSLPFIRKADNRAVLWEIHVKLFLERDGSYYTFSIKPKGPALCKMLLQKKKKVTISPLLSQNSQALCFSCSWATANTQGFICKADRLVIWYPSILVMVWVPGFLIKLHGSGAKMESINFIYCHFQVFCNQK